MKLIYRLFLFSVVLISCKSDKKTEKPSEMVELTILEKVAHAHGFQNWNTVEEIGFTFNVDRDSSHFERSWVWFPKKNEVIHINGADSLRYNRKNMDSIAFQTNAGFINDRYWLLAPFNLIWDNDNFNYEYQKEAVAPISGNTLQKLTIVYRNEGGYTPGDAYDFYLGDNNLIREWVFRKANQSEPSMTTTWENYSDFEGFKFVRDHKKKDEAFNLYIDGISVKTEQQ